MTEELQPLDLTWSWSGKAVRRRMMAERLLAKPDEIVSIETIPPDPEEIP